MLTPNPLQVLPGPSFSLG